MVWLSKNNVHVSGELLTENPSGTTATRLMIGIPVDNSTILPVWALVNQIQWNKFKSEYNPRFVTIAGQLQHISRNGEDCPCIKATSTPTSITQFYNGLIPILDESKCQFHGAVVLKKKFDFDTPTKLYLKRIILESCSNPSYTFEAVTLRGITSCFDNIQEGTSL